MKSLTNGSSASSVGCGTRMTASPFFPFITLGDSETVVMIPLGSSSDMVTTMFTGRVNQKTGGKERGKNRVAEGTKNKELASHDQVTQWGRLYVVYLQFHRLWGLIMVDILKCVYFAHLGPPIHSYTVNISARGIISRTAKIVIFQLSRQPTQ